MRTARGRCRDEGFTLVELLVVMVVIGVLAAIAVPTMLAQRQKAVEASLKTDLRTVAESQELHAHDDQGYLAFTRTQNPVVDDPVTLSAGNSAEVVVNPAGTAFCVVTSNPRTPKVWVYVSSRGGQQPGTVQACPATF